MPQSMIHRGGIRLRIRLRVPTDIGRLARDVMVATCAF